jgi:hypothetical protein
MVKWLLGEAFKGFSPPLLVTRREVLCANVVVSSSRRVSDERAELALLREEGET